MIRFQDACDEIKIDNSARIAYFTSMKNRNLYPYLLFYAFIVFLVFFQGCNLSNPKDASQFQTRDQTASKTTIEVSDDIDDELINLYIHFCQLYLEGEFKDALDVMNELINRKPNDFSLQEDAARTYLITYYQEVRDYGEMAYFYLGNALLHAFKALEIKPNDETMLHITEEIASDLIPYYISQSDLNFTLLVRVINRVKNVLPSWDIGDYYLGEAYRTAGKLPEAIDYYQKCLEKKPDNYGVLLALAQAYWRQRSYDKAISLYEKLLELNPNDVTSRYELSLIHLANGDDEKFLDIHNTLLTTERAGVGVAYDLIDYYIENKNVDNAQRVLDEATFYHENKEYELKLYYALSLRQVKHYKEAESQLLDLLDEDYTIFETYEGLYWLYREQEKYEDAYSILSMAMLHFSDLPNIYLLHAALDTELQKYETALEWIEKGMKKTQNYQPFYFQKAVIYEKTKEYDKCVGMLKSILKLDSSNAEALNFLGYLYADQGVKLDDAQTLIEKALELNPDNAAYLDSLGWVYYQRGEYGEAIRYLNRAHDQLEDDPVILDHLGDTHAKLNNLEKALQAYRQALDYIKTQDSKFRETVSQKVKTLEAQIGIP